MTSNTRVSLRQKPRQLLFWLLVIGVSSLLLILFSLAQVVFPPNTYINSIKVAWLTLQQAGEVVQQHSSPPPSQTLSVTNPTTSQTTIINSQLLNPTQDYTQTVWNAWEPQLSPVQRVVRFVNSLFGESSWYGRYLLSQQQVVDWLLAFSSRTTTANQPPSVTLETSGATNSIQVNPGVQGSWVDATATAQLIQQEFEAATKTGAATTAAPFSLLATMVLGPTPLTEQEVEQTRARAERFVGTTLAVTTSAKQLNQTISDRELVSFLQPPDQIDRNKIRTLVAQWQPTVDIEPKNAVLQYDPNTLVVSEFVPPTDGRSLDIEQTTSNIVQYLHSVDAPTTTSTEGAELTTSPVVQLAIATAKPTTDLRNTNNLGIQELIGFGDSHYDGSIPSRVHNVTVATNKVTNVIVKPGEEFSFNQTIGEVSKATGYQAAYIIRNGMTELGDGGGVCQVSTTLFRAVLDAGLQVTKRLPHSYRVSYYELDRKPGVDATVYAGDVDLRFVNDTPNHILIHGEAYPTQRYMTYSIYGTSDGRTTQIVDHETWGYSPPPAPVYIEDPSLSPGSRKQIDWASAGINARFSNVISDAQGNVVRTDTYTSRYRPWSAKYLVGPGYQP